MTNLELSNHIRENHKINNKSSVQRKPIYGIGINDSDYCCQPKPNGKRIVCPAFRAWSGMLNRSYRDKNKHHSDAYYGVSVSSEWHSFMRFREWWTENHVDGWQLDKDLLIPGNKVYGPSSCIYVPGWINAFTIDSRAARGKYPIGVTIHVKTGKFQANCINHATCKNGYIGLFDSQGEAHEAWRKRKLEIALVLKADMDRVDPRIYHGIVEIIKRAK